MIIITEEINKALRKKHEENEHSTDISISGLGKCLRQLIMTERGYTKKPEYIPYTDAKIGTFEMGYQVEYLMLDSLGARGLKVARQIPTEYRGIKGTADFIVKDEPMNVLMDCKSCHSKKIGYIKAQNFQPDKQHSLQLTGYYLGLMKAGNKYNISPLGRVLYVDKDTNVKVETPCKFETFVPKVNEFIDNIEIARKSTDLPPEIPPDEKGLYKFPCFKCDKKQNFPLYCQLIKNCPVVYAKYKQLGGEL